jgi:uncharacterized membrane protein
MTTLATDRALPDPAQAEATQQPEHNVGDIERYTSLAAGAIVALLGLYRRDIPGIALAAVGGALIYRGASGNCAIYHALGINTAEDAETQRESRFAAGVHVSQAFTIDRSPEDLYNEWHNFENLPRIMTHLESVTVLDERRSHWVASAPSIAGGSVEWDAEKTQDEPNRFIAWKSLPGADVDNAGCVSFEPSPRGTIVRVDLRYVAPGGRLGSWVAKLFGEEPDHQIREDLRKFKRYMELGEVPTTKGQSRGTCSGRGKRSSN